jgi:hypothetical protein
MYDVNPARITIHCPVCGQYQFLSQTVESTYGEVVGRECKKVFLGLERLGTRKDSDTTSIIELAAKKIETIIELFKEGK